MKILFLALFFGIARIFSSASGFSGISADDLDGLHDLKYMEHDPVSVNSLGIWKDNMLENKKILNLFRRFAEENESNSTADSNHLDSVNGLNTAEQPLTFEEAFLIEALASYLGSGFSKKGCVAVMSLICPKVSEYPGLSDTIRKTMLKKCEKINETCDEADARLPAHCKHVKGHYEAKNGKFLEHCSTYQSKCISLKAACKGILDDMCKIVEEKCPKQPKPIKPAVSATIVNLHTSIVDKTLYETETVVYIETEVVMKIKTCCNDKPFLTSCEPTTTHETEPPADDECSITSTITVTSHGATLTKTVTIISATDGSKNTITDKGDSTKMDGLRKLGLVYLIVGITAGIWIVV